jgi:LmbE family N-acetylglucosaminyl deacetylase
VNIRDVLILSPHLDDAVLSAWCDLPGAAVANLCTAVPPAGLVGDFDRTKGALDGAAFMAARLAEDRAALALAGVGSILELAFLDAQYRDGPLDPDAIRAALPRAERILAPAGLGGHPDHVAARDAALATGVPVTLYADLPYAARVGWPAWVTGEAQRQHLIPEARWELFLAAVPGRLRGRALALDAGQRAAKERALRMYATQFEVLNGGPVNRLLNPAVLGFEVRWDVSPA